MRPDHAREVRYALSDPRQLCAKLGLLEGAKRQARGLLIRCPVHGERDPSCSVTQGPDGTVLVKCFSCQWSGDALSLVAHHFGLSLKTDFREVLASGAELAGHHGLASEIRDGAPAPDRKPVAAPEPQPEREYPPLDEVRDLWATCGPANDDPDVSALLVSRRIDPDAVTRMDLARALPQDGRLLGRGGGNSGVLGGGRHLPSWAAYKGRSWADTGHRLILRAWDSRGGLRSVRSWRVVDGSTPKRLPPAGCKAAELVQANREAWLMLAGRACPMRLVIVEGEPDWLVASTALVRGDAVIGIGSGSWTEDFARRVPRGTEVIVATHADEAGDRYAAHVLETLGDQRPTYRWRMAS